MARSTTNYADKRIDRKVQRMTGRLTDWEDSTTHGAKYNELRG